MAAYIFDFDGTLVDSYPSIVDKILRIDDKLGWKYSYDEIYENIIRTSTAQFLDTIINKENSSWDEYTPIYNSIKENTGLITLIPGVYETLEHLVKEGNQLFIFSHRGNSIYEVMDRLDISKFFIEIIDTTKGFPRKPCGDANKYLVKKYNLNPNETYYVGDRKLDIDSANDANIKSVLFMSSGIEFEANATYKIKNFIELKTLVK